MIGLVGSPRTFSIFFYSPLYFINFIFFQFGYGAFTDTIHLGYIPLGNPSLIMPYGIGPVKICHSWHDPVGRQVTTKSTITHYKTFNEIHQIKRGILKSENVLGDPNNQIIN